MAEDPVIVVIRYEARPGQGDRAEAELRALVREVVAREPDCLGIRLHADHDDRTRFLLYETWTSRAAYAGPHMKTPHLTSFIARAGALFAGPPTIEYWSLTDDLAARH